jgi:hypothetical protein
MNYRYIWAEVVYQRSGMCRETFWQCLEQGGFNGAEIINLDTRAAVWRIAREVANAETAPVRQSFINVRQFFFLLRCKCGHLILDHHEVELSTHYALVCDVCDECVDGEVNYELAS